MRAEVEGLALRQRTVSMIKLGAVGMSLADPSDSYIDRDDTEVRSFPTFHG